MEQKLNQKVIIVTEYFYPNNNSTAYIMTDIVEAISKVKDIKVICNAQLQKKDELQFLKKRIIRLKESTLSKDKLFSRVLRLIILTSKLSSQTFIAIKKNDHLFALTEPAFLVVVLAMFKKIKKFEYTLLVHDVFPENLLAAGLTQNNSLLYKISKKIFDWAYGQTDRLIVIGRDMEEVIGSKTNNNVPLSLITNWCDIETVKPLPKKENVIIQQLNTEDKIVFSFVGNFGRVQGIQNLLDAASLVKNENFVLLFIGDGAMRSTIEEYIDEDPNGNVMYGGNFPASEQKFFLNACDVSLISLDSSMYGLGVPSKSYYNMAAGKPLLLIGDERSEIGRVIKEHNIGWVTSSSNSQKLAEQFEEICHDDSLHIKGQKSRSVVEQFYSKRVIMGKYKELYKDY